MKGNSLPLSDTLHDLAVLRASDIDLSQVLDPPQRTELDESVEKSLQFIKEARAALKLESSGSLDQQGANIEEVRTLAEGVVARLGPQGNW